MSKPKPSAQQSQLQALVICDTFSSLFGDTTEHFPEILLPICNEPLLHYTLQFLASQPVSEIIIASANSSELVSQYLQYSFFFCSFNLFPFLSFLFLFFARQSQWGSWETPTITFVQLQNVHNVPDCFNQIADQDIITGDFIFVLGGIVSNVDMTPYIDFHKFTPCLLFFFQ